jgi:hypothetical protein
MGLELFTRVAYATRSQSREYMLIQTTTQSEMVFCKDVHREHHPFLRLRVITSFLL